MPQEFLQNREFLVGSIHILIRSLDIVLRQGKVRLIHIVIEAAESGENVAAKAVALRLLLQTNRLDTAFGCIGACAEIGIAITSDAEFLSRRSGARRGRS